MSKTAILSVRILGDAKGAITALDSLSTKAKVAATALGAAMVAGGVKAIGLAGDLEQSVGAIDTVFKASAATMHDYATQAAKSVGLARDEYNQLATVLGTQLKNGGTALGDLAGKTNDLIVLGADLASMFGGTTSSAVEALSAALKGERDPIERYGVSLTQAAIDAEAAALGFTKVGGALSTQASQAATLSLIMKQTADAQGNFSRESGTWAQQVQVFKAQVADLGAKVGQMLLPAVTQLATWLNTSVVPAMQALVPWIQQHSTLLLTIATGIGGAVAAWKTYQTATMAVQVAQALLNVTLTANPIGVIVVAIGGAVAALVTLWNTSEGFRNAVSAVFNTVKTAVMSGLAAFTAFKNAVADVFTSVTGWFRNLPGTITGAFSGAGNLLVNAGRNIINGLFNGLKQKWEAVKSWVSGLGTWIANHKGPLSYDRRLLQPAGSAIMDGLSHGLRQQMPSLRRTLGAITDTISLGITPTLTYTPSSAHPSSSSITVNITGGYVDDATIGRLVDSLNQWASRRGERPVNIARGLL